MAKGTMLSNHPTTGKELLLFSFHKIMKESDNELGWKRPSKLCCSNP